jgi:hypothetical protein
MYHHCAISDVLYYAEFRNWWVHANDVRGTMLLIDGGESRTG